MKTIRNILITLLIILVLLLIVGLFLPSDRHIESKIIISAPAYIVFNQVDNLRNWENWSPWAVRDSQMIMVYEGPASGVGAVSKWNSPLRQTGRGSIKILESRPYEFILIEIGFMERGKVLCPWVFSNTAGGTTVVWGLDMKNMNLAERYFSLFVPGMLEPYYKQGLDSLKSVSERLHGMLGKIEELEIKAIPAITISDSAIISNDVFRVLAGFLGELSAYCKQRRIKPAAPPYCIYHRWDPKGYSKIEAGIPVPVSLLGKGRIKPAQSPSGKALKIEYTGPYSSIVMPYEILIQYIKNKAYSVAGSPWEVYLKGPWSEPDSTKWVTYIYYPVK